MALLKISNLRGPEGKQGKQGEPGERGLPGVNAVANDTATAAQIAAEDSETRAALESDFLSREAGELITDQPWRRVIADLDSRRPDGLVIAVASDSTMDQENEAAWLAMQDHATAIWPDRPITGHLWVKGSTAYGAPVVIHGAESGGELVPDQLIVGDQFAGDGELMSRAADFGGEWSGSGTGNYVTSGGRVRLVSGSSGQFLYSPVAPLESAKAEMTVQVTHSTGLATPNRFDIGLGANADNQIRLLVEGQNTLSVKAQKIVGGTITDLGTFASVPWGSTASEQPVSIEITTSRAVTVKVGAASVTGTLSASDAAVIIPLAGVRSIIRAYSGLQGVWALGMFEIIADKRTDVIVSPLAPMQYYNAGAAGETLDSYHVQHLAAMFPEPVDLLLINMGHNYGAGVTLDQLEASLTGFVDALEALHGKRPAVALDSQNPRFGTATDELHRQRMMSYRDIARRNRWAYLPTYEAFSALADGGESLIGDGIHPSPGAARTLQAAAIGAWLRTQSQRPS